MIKKLFLLASLLCASCAEMPTEPAAENIYSGAIIKFLVLQQLESEKLLITLTGDKGTFTSRGKITIVDSIRMITATDGYLFPSDICFDTAFAWTKTLQPIHIEREGTTLRGNLPADWAGFRFIFSTTLN